MSKQIVTYKYKLLLTQEQKCDLWETITQYTEAYNIILDCCFDRDDIKNHPMLHNEMYYEIREIFPDLNADYVNTCCHVGWETIKSQQALNRKKYKTAKRPPKSMLQSSRMTHHLFSYNIKNNTFSIASIDGRLKNIDFVNPAYTSQACPNCGHISTGNRPQCDTFLCESCNYGGFDDYITAHNIFKLVSVSSP